MTSRSVEELPTDTLAYSVPMAARLLGIGPGRTWDLIREGTIGSFTDGGRRLVSRRALEDYLAEQTGAEVNVNR
jgi:excisionase family DNA binding protein